jgi:hypothetical protein
MKTSARKIFWGVIAVIILVGASRAMTEEQPRTLTEDDFLWDEVISPYKDLIITSVNKIHREVEGCSVINPDTAYLAVEKTASGAPRFFVTCGSMQRAFNVYFSENGIERPR